MCTFGGGEDCQNFGPGDRYKRAGRSYGGRGRRARRTRATAAEASKSLHPGTEGSTGGLNLLLAFNGVCKLYLGGGIRVRDRARGRGRRERKRGWFGHVTRGPVEVEEWKRRVERMRAVKIDDKNKTKENAGNGGTRTVGKNSGRKRHSCRLPHKLPKKALLQVSVRV